MTTSYAALTLRQRVAGRPWRRRLAGRPLLDRLYRATVAVVGSAVVAVGLVTVPLPGPGWLTVLAGLLVLSSEFPGAERLLAHTRRRVQRWADWLAAQPWTVRLAVATGTAVSSGAAVVVVLRVVGVPHWVPDAVPLWR